MKSNRQDGRGGRIEESGSINQIQMVLLQRYVR